VYLNGFISNPNPYFLDFKSNPQLGLDINWINFQILNI